MAVLYHAELVKRAAEVMTLQRRILGSTGFKASILGIGDLADRAVPLETCVATIHRAMDAGLNLIDTAPGYEDGYSEAIVGAALRGRREGMFVIDKIDELDKPVGPQVDASLKALGLDMVDLFVVPCRLGTGSVEGVGRSGGRHGAAWAGDESGKAAASGAFPSHHPEVLRQALESGLCDVVMFPVGPFCDRRYAEEILPLARQKGVGTVCFKTFGAGKLLGDTTRVQPPPGAPAAGQVQLGGKRERCRPSAAAPDGG